MYNLEEYDYKLDPMLIAQSPVEPRDSCRLLVVDRKEKTFEDKIFRDISQYIGKDDIIVLNNTRVIPARLFGKKDSGAEIEVLLLEKLDKPNMWKCLVKPGGKIKSSSRLIFSKNLSANVIEHLHDGSRIIEFEGIDVWKEICLIGQTPLPPYIHEKIDDPEKYQTKYAKVEGAVAAPTAGLHFTSELIEKIKANGTKFAELTLHVGLGTFRPIKENDIRNHEIHEEYYSIDKSTKEKIDETKKNGGRVIAVGTTVVRTLETVGIFPDRLFGKTDIYIYPPFDFKYVDCLITNFHLPKSSLLLLVSAFSGHETIMDAYKKAVADRYRFFSFGDAMFIK